MSLGLQETINLIRDPFRLNNVFIIGGGEIYKQLLPFCSRVYVTKIYTDHENVDTFFPNLDESEDWELSVSGRMHTYNDMFYQFLEYDRIS
jgi:dihydrofolate reductase